MAEESPSGAAAGAGRIRRLPEAVVNRIAAGEIIQRPVSALKEMLENSLDAGATQINVTVKEGGSRLLQIQDNGHGIQLEDLPLLCERHATSKLAAFEDLTGISTFGFRGEALASISYIAHMSVTTMTPGAAHGHRVTYRDGVMDAAGPKPCATVPGTTIVAEDLFYNVPTRKKALRNASEELARILDVVGCYAVFKPSVGFTVKKQGESRADLHCLPTASRQDSIRTVYGAAVARNLLELQLSRAAGEAGGSEGGGSQGPQYRVDGLMTGADYSGKKTVLVLFINGRPVECAPLRRALEAAYASLLPKAAKPFVFLDVALPGEHVDVNLHPTKREVGFLYRDELIAALCAAAEGRLAASNVQRTFTQTQLHGPCSQAAASSSPAQPPDGQVHLSTRRDKAGGDHKLVRTDSRARTLDAFLRPAGRDSPLGAAAAAAGSGGGPSQQQQQQALAGTRRRGADRGVVRLREQWEAEEQQQQQLAAPLRQQPNPPVSELGSIQELLAAVGQRAHAGLSDAIRNHTYVGMADGCRALLQHRTSLLLLDLTAATRELFYQQVLARFERLQAIKVSDRPPVRSLALLALQVEAEQQPQEDGVSAEEVAELVEALLLEKAPMLAEYLGLEIDGQGRLLSLPQLIEGWAPDTDRLPAFVLDLARRVDWGSERECFDSLAQVVAELFCWQEPLFPEEAPPAAESPPVAESSAAGAAPPPPPPVVPLEREWLVQNVLLPALREFWRPGKACAGDGTVVELTRLEQLYRIFERC